MTATGGGWPSLNGGNFITAYNNSTVTVGKNMQAAEGATNMIHTAHGGIVTVNGYMTATNNGTNAIDCFGGNNSVNVKNWLIATEANNVIFVTNSENSSVNVAAMSANVNGQNTIDCIGAHNTVSVASGVVAQASGAQNAIDLSGYYNNVTIVKGIHATVADSRNDIWLNHGNWDAGGTNILKINGDIKSSSGFNEILFTGDYNEISVKGSLSAVAGGKNEIGSWFNSSESRDDIVSITGCLVAQGDSSLNMITGEDITVDEALNASIGGENKIELLSWDWYDAKTYGEFNGGLVAASQGTNYISTFEATEITVLKGINAGTGGQNIIDCSQSSDTASISISGPIRATGGGENAVYTGSGNDEITIAGTITAGSLTIDAGDGYDVLVMTGSSAASFNSGYGAWFRGIEADQGLSSMNVEVIQAKLYSASQVASLEWLGELAQNNGIDMHLNLNHAGSAFNLSALFSSQHDDIYSVLDFTGGIKNTLTISGGLERNGLNADSLMLRGDNIDVVKLSNDWSDTAAMQTDFNAGVTYAVYENNATHDQLLIQTELNVLFA